MHAVVRETHYAPDFPLRDSPEFTAFQDAHAALEGYLGTVLVEAGAGRHITLTLWRDAAAMDAAREAMGRVVAETVAPRMSAPATLLGTGPVLMTDLLQADASAGPHGSSRGA